MPRPLFALTRRAFTGFVQIVLRYRKDLLIPTALLVCAGGVLSFIGLASEIEERDLETYDRAILLSMRVPGAPHDPIGPPWMEEMGRDITALGGFTILTGLTFASIGMMLASAALTPYVPGFARGLLLLAITLHLAIGLALLARVLRGEGSPAMLVPPLMIPLVGN
eukprot:gene50317-61562_t